MINRSSKRKRRVFFLGCLLLLILFLFLSTRRRGFIQQIRIKQEKERLIKEIETLEEQKTILEEEKERLNDPEYIEKIAREKYGMAKEGEDVYRVVPKEKE